jgi:hypothetical protein
MLRWISEGATYEKILQALEDCIGEELFAAAYRSQNKVRTQKAEESLHDFATAIQHLSRRAYRVSSEEHLKREAGNIFVEGIQDYEIKIRLILGGEMTLSEVLRQALEVHDVLIAAWSQRSNNGASSWTRSPPSNGGMQGVREVGKRETTNHPGTGEGRRKRANAGNCIKHQTSRVDRHFGKHRP